VAVAPLLFLPFLKPLCFLRFARRCKVSQEGWEKYLTNSLLARGYFKLPATREPVGSGIPDNSIVYRSAHVRVGYNLTLIVGRKILVFAGPSCPRSRQSEIGKAAPAQGARGKNRLNDFALRLRKDNYENNRIR
jgi:hypothetical protein